MTEFQQRAYELIDAGKQLYAAGMLPATSGNLSARLSDNSLAITVSGAHKGFLTKNDIMSININGESLDGQKASAETLLHTSIYQRCASANVVLHPHSINSTVLSKLCEDWLILQDFELLKAFSGIDTHEYCMRVPIFENDQDINRLAEVVDECLAKMEITHGYLIRGHGFYTWGKSMSEALRHIEAFEYLFDCELQLKGGNNDNIKCV